MKNVDRFLNRQKEKVTSPERLEKKRIKKQLQEAARADEIYGPEEERENRREAESLCGGGRQEIPAVAVNVKMPLLMNSRKALPMRVDLEANRQFNELFGRFNESSERLSSSRPN